MLEYKPLYFNWEEITMLTKEELYNLRKIELLKDIHSNKPFTVNDTNTHFISKVISELVENKDYNNVIFLAKNIKNFDITLFEELILDTNNIDLIYSYLENVKQARKNVILSKLLQLNPPPNIFYKIALNIENINIDLMQKIILSKNDVKYIYLFAKNISNVDIDKIQNAIIVSNNLYYIYLFAKNIDNANIELLTKKLIDLKGIDYFYIFARDIKGANIPLLEEATIKYGTSEDIYYFAEGIPNANINKLQDAIIVLNDPYYMYLFAKNIKNSDIHVLQQAIYRTNDLEHIKLMNELVKIRQEEKEFLKKLRMIVKVQKEERYNSFINSDILDFSSGFAISYSKIQSNINKNRIKNFLLNSIDIEEFSILLQVYYDFLFSDKQELSEAIILDREYKLVKRKV